MTTLPVPLVSIDWLAHNLSDPALVVLDATWLMGGGSVAGRERFDQAHVPGAQFFDIDAVSDPSSGLPHMLPSAAHFAQAMGELGVDEHCDVVVYDTVGIFSAPRLWWTLRAFGHSRVAVLDGGLPAWKVAHPVTSELAPRQPRSFRARHDPALVRSEEQVRHRACALLDARSAGRFAGVDPEPRPGLRGGHVPGSINVPFSSLLSTNTGGLLAPSALRDVLEAAGVDPAAPSIATCGSGITACIIALGLARLGNWDVAIYDGAWAEWGRPGGPPVEP
jgi:thiosulfate/3-mercaptopyruvate sulfurtransferase